MDVCSTSVGLEMETPFRNGDTPDTIFYYDNWDLITTIWPHQFGHLSHEKVDGMIEVSYADKTRRIKYNLHGKEYIEIM